MNSCEIRQRFFDFFVKAGHTHVPSASLVPADDPTLLFTNAGMVPFKDYFLGRKAPPWPAAVSSQRCVRAGGKHNDLDNVGKTARHHTFFEMLGFFSFGAYFKEKAIELAWSFLTQDLNIPQDKLWVTVHESDQEAADIWHKQIGVAKERIVFCGDADNFWAMGDSGPCGPCTEIFYDHGPSVVGGPPGSDQADGDRFVEIWNLVFMQYNRQDGQLLALPTPAVDTGMGLERIAAVLQGVHDNYDIDIFQHLQLAITKTFSDQTIEPLVTRVLADHLRAMVFLLADGVLPSNEGRGYVLRRIMRRAMCYAHRAGLPLPCLHRWAGVVFEHMADVYPEGGVALEQVAHNIEQEEMRFAETLQTGLSVLAQMLEADRCISGADAFRLYDTYGLPLEVTIDWAVLHGGSVDEAGFAACMAEQKERSKAHQGFQAESVLDVADVHSQFTGLEALEGEGQVQALLLDGQRVEQLKSGQVGALVLDQTTLYPEGGGQVGDQGQITCAEAIFVVKDSQKVGDAIVHHGMVQTGVFSQSDRVQTHASSDRLQTAAHHSATHLLHAALRDCLGSGVSQRGSLVAPDRLRFDFAYDQALSLTDLQRLESWVNRAIRANLPTKTVYMDLDEAKQSGAMALFDEKYDQKVRVLKIGALSTELCGGTHVVRTGDIGVFIILNSSSVASGIRRIEALAGVAAEVWLQNQTRMLHDLASVMQCNVDQLSNKAQAMQAQIKQLQKAQKGQDQAGLRHVVEAWYGEAEEHLGVRTLVQVVDAKYAKQLREIADVLRDQKGAWQAVFVVVGQKPGDRVPFLCAVSKGHVSTRSAKDLLAYLAPMGAKGGGRPDFIQGAMVWADDMAAQLLTIKDKLG